MDADKIRDAGGPAFPGLMDPGITLRDYFAAAALTGLQIWDAVINGKNTGLDTQSMAEISYSVADAMLAERIK